MTTYNRLIAASVMVNLTANHLWVVVVVQMSMGSDLQGMGSLSLSLSPIK